MHLTENKAARNGELFAPCDNKYIDPPNQKDLQEERLQINIYITLINHYSADDIDYSFLVMIGAPQSSVHG
jgi:hypothetical protein